MKKNRIYILYGYILISSLLILITNQTTHACEACNQLFLRQLQESERAGGLVSKELLATIEAQQHIGRNNPANTEIGLSNQLIASSGIALQNPTPVNAAVATQPTERQRKAVPLPGNTDFIDIIRRDNGLSIPPTSFVPQTTTPDVRISITLDEGDSYIGNGVIYKGFTIDGVIPGPTLIVDEGDIVDFTIVNKGTLPHGASIHSVNSQTSKYLGKIEPNDSAKVVFQANTPGVYMYHCAPGGHAIPMHIIFGQYGMMVVRPKQKFELEKILGKEPDIEIFL